MIDERALQAAIAEAREQLDVKGLHEDEELAIIIAIITAYEQALWRPIEEAPRDGTKFLAMWTDEPRRIVIMWWWEFGEGWTTEEGKNRYPPDHSICHGLMYRTIEPPETKP